MSEFDFNLDIEAELAGIRGHKEKPTPKSKARPEAERAKPEQKPERKPDKPEGLEVKQSQQETPGNSGQAKNTDDPIGWKQFKTLKGIFEHVGGARPVRLNPKIRKSQVSGIPEPMLGAIQEHLKEKYLGAVLDFPWGEYTVTDKNRVFHSNPSLMRYLLFDAFRDSDGTHVQYAKQWMVLQHPVFDEGFNPDTHLGPNNDELDIYVLLFVGHMREDYSEPSNTVQSEQDYQTAEKLSMLNMSMSRVLDKLNEQEQALEASNRQTSMIQTVLLLDRMGLLKGGLPRDVGEFVRVLEQNRDALSQTDSIVNNHIESEKERQKTLARQERMRNMQARQSR